MQVEDFERVLRQAAADQPPVSRTARRDVVRRARVHRAERAVVALAALAGAAALVSLSVGAFKGPRKGTALATKPGPPTTLKPAPGPTTPVPTALTTVPPTVPSTLAGGPVVGPVPPGFVATSVTFVSPGDGWVLGGANCSAPPASAPCPAVLLRTADSGKTWVRIPAPPVSLAQSAIESTGVSQLRFGSLQDGWVFGPDLWATHDGGGHWARSVLGGVPSAMSVMSLEAGAGFVHAAVFDQSNPQTVPQFRFETSPIGRDNWQASPTTLQIGAGPIPTVQIVLQGQAGWAIENDRVVIAGVRLIHGAWMPWNPPCTTAGGPATLAAFDSSDVVAVCNEGLWNASPQGVRSYFSTDGGVTFHETRVPVPASGGFGFVANPAPGTVVLDTTNPVHNNLPELLATFDGGATWRTVYTAHVNASGPWSSLGFTTATQGEAIFGSPLTGGQLVMTTDGGHHWVTVAFRSG